MIDFESMFHEYQEMMRLKALWPQFGKVEVLASVPYKNGPFIIPSFTIGSDLPKLPTLFVSGGVHGLERIGTEVALAFMNHIASRVSWDQLLKDALTKVRVIFVPLVNPIGMMKLQRCNGNGVDLMRNAPLTSSTASPWVGGQNFSPRLPWFRGNPAQTEDGMEIESSVLLKLVEEELKNSSFFLSLDLHSGFGLQDQLWYPFAHTRERFRRQTEIDQLQKLLDTVLPNHIYRFEPQAKNYTTHGDLWDYAFLKHQKDSVFLPLTLEMGSWSWVKKNPLQLFSLSGPFNPMKPHRKRRALRRHLPLFDFLLHATASHSHWLD